MVDAVVAVAAAEVVVVIKIKQMTIQWHLTDKCNYRCLHCYQDEYIDNSLSLQTNTEILEKIHGFINKLSKRNPQIRCHINFTGGEPFLYQPLLELLKIVVREYDYTFGILSNGLLLPDYKLKELSELKPKFIQLSLEGGQDVNDLIRGLGAYKNVKNAIESYKKLKIPVIISFTANAKNIAEYPKVVRFARRYKIKKIWTDRYLPFGPVDELELKTDQFKYLNSNIYGEKKKLLIGAISRTEISSSRALQFIESGGKPYRCSAGASLLTILPNGDLLPCRRLPIKLGNVLRDDLIDIYYKDPVLLRLRDANDLDDECKECVYKNDCFGGLKCLSYIKTGNFHSKDPNCYIK